MPTVIEQLELEWERLAVDRRAAARLAAICSAGGAANLGELEAYVRQAAPAAADEVLVALVGPASAGEQLEARVLLQLLLPGVRRLARRWGALGPRDERESLSSCLCKWGRASCSDVRVDAVGVGEGELFEGLFPVRGDLAFDEPARGFASLGG
jgi:hypothetical protein